MLLGGVGTLLAANRRRPEEPGRVLGEPHVGPEPIELVRRIPLAPAVADLFYFCDVSSGGKYALVTRDIGNGCETEILDVATGKRTFAAGAGLAGFLGDGERVLIPTERFPVHEARSGRLLGQSAEKQRVAYSWKEVPGGRYIVCWGPDGYALYDLELQREARFWEYAKPVPRSLGDFHFTADGRFLFLRRGRDEPWFAWDLAQDRASAAFPGLAGAGEIISVLPDARTAYATREGQPSRLDLRTGEVLGSLEERVVPDDEEDSEPVAGASSLRGRCYVIRLQNGTFLVYRQRFGGPPVARYRLPADDRSLSRHKLTKARLALALDDRHAALLTPQSLYILRLPEFPEGVPA
jgi:hypothetical protein